MKTLTGKSKINESVDTYLVFLAASKEQGPFCLPLEFIVLSHGAHKMNCKTELRGNTMDY